MGKVIFAGISHVTREPRPYTVRTWIARQLTPWHEQVGKDEALLRVKLQTAQQQVNHLRLVVQERDSIIAGLMKKLEKAAV